MNKPTQTGYWWVKHARSRSDQVIIAFVESLDLPNSVNIISSGMRYSFEEFVWLSPIPELVPPLPPEKPLEIPAYHFEKPNYKRIICWFIGHKGRPCLRCGKFFKNL